MRFKNIYVEITNVCNMNCSFCKKESRPLQFLSLEEFKIIINKIKPYTNQVYLHVKGEPLLHPNLKEILDTCYNNNIKVNITTNGTLLKEKLDTIINSKAIRQINISLHSNLNNNNYLNDIFYVTDVINKKTSIYLNYRLWNMHEETDFVSKINDHFNIDITKSNIINDHLFVELEHVFKWPTLNSEYYNEKGKCYGLTNQISILVNGDITPCCLDSESIIKLGNIFKEDLTDVINSDKANRIIKGFRNNQKCEELCKHCDFLNNRND